MIHTDIYYLVERTIPKELRMFYPIEEHKELLEDFLITATKDMDYQRADRILNINAYVNEKYIMAVLHSLYWGNFKLPTSIKMYLDELAGKLIPVVNMYNELSCILSKVRPMIEDMNPSEDDEIFMIGFLVDYHSIAIQRSLPKLPDNLYIKQRDDRIYGKVDVNVVFERVIDNHANFLDKYYLAKGVNLL